MVVGDPGVFGTPAQRHVVGATGGGGELATIQHPQMEETTASAARMPTGLARSDFAPEWSTELGHPGVDTAHAQGHVGQGLDAGPEPALIHHQRMAGEAVMGYQIQQPPAD